MEDEDTNEGVWNEAPVLDSENDELDLPPLVQSSSSSGDER